ncbi:MAG: hypothetical protein AAB432_02750 [Patescibacteria group bacterium]
MEKEIKKDYFLPVSVIIAAIFIAVAVMYKTGLENPNYHKKTDIPINQNNIRESEILSNEGIILPIRWGDLGIKMTNAGVIDKQKIETLYADRGGLDSEERKLLENTENGEFRITKKNSAFLLNLFWALGLGMKNDILGNGEMNNPQYGGAGNFASTGGWTLANGDAMNHYNRHQFITLTPEKQQLVERVSKNIYRPCCGNSTHFPDCNHGMAMLGFLELAASQGASENQMYKAALALNSYWFPDTYLTIAKYFQSKGIAWNSVDPKNILAANYSSAQGYQQLLKEITPVEDKSSGSCGI